MSRADSSEEHRVPTHRQYGSQAESATLRFPCCDNDALRPERLRYPLRALGRGLREVVDAFQDADVLEPRCPDRLHVLRLDGGATDAVRPELRAQPADGAHVHLHHDAGELEAPAGLQHPENLAERGGVVRYDDE